MKETPFVVDFNAENEGQDLRELAGKYLPYWPWFLLAVLLCTGGGYLYMRYAPITYTSTAKIKIIDDSREANLAEDPAQLIGLGTGINLDNEIEVLSSYRMLSQVVQALQLDLRYYQQGNIKTTEIWEPPFVLEKAITGDSLLPEATYEVTVGPNAFSVLGEGGKRVEVPFSSGLTDAGPFPLSLRVREQANLQEALGITYLVRVVPLKQAVIDLREALEVYPTNKDSDILSLTLSGESVARSEAILNTLVEKFDQDGIRDRQLVSKRTLEVIDDRFLYLSRELDSIESGKENFKQSNNLSYIEADAGLTLQQKAETEEEVLQLENQLELSRLLQETLQNQAEFNLLPADIGLENVNLNALVNDYNQLALERQKLLPNVGLNHPNLQTLSGQLERGKANIVKSVNVYQAQLLTSLEQLSRRRSAAGFQFARLPEKERTLRAIERQQSIKEKLFLILLEKREEAAINVAATAPSVKVVDHALTGHIPVSPRKTIVYPLSLALGVLLPFLFFFVRFSLNTKIQGRADLDKMGKDVPVVAEIPFFKEQKSFMGVGDRSVLAEAFRMLCTNMQFRLPKRDTGKGRVVFVTSSIKGEGKTLVALNTSLSLASLNKKVLLVGADLRNPQLHQYLGINRQKMGLCEYLMDPGMPWQDCVQDGPAMGKHHQVCYSATVPPSAPELLSGDAFANFMDKAREVYDFIVVDTAPTLLVSDTLLLSGQADITLFVLRAGYSDKRLLDFAAELHKDQKLHNLAFVLNEVGHGTQKRYNYGHAYGYGPGEEG